MEHLPYEERLSKTVALQFRGRPREYMIEVYKIMYEAVIENWNTEALKEVDEYK